MLQNSRRGVHIKGGRQIESPSENSLVVDSLRNEVSILSRKLGSKTEALCIMAKDLDQCRLDRDQFRSMLEQLRGSHKVGSSSWSVVATDAGLRHQLALSRQQCTELEQTVNDLRQKMEEVCGDMMVLRRDAVRQRRQTAAGSEPPPAESRQDMVQKLEQLQGQCDQLRRDLELMLDEKEELVTQRDAYKGKAHRLNHQLKVALRASTDSTLDVDSLVTENRYLREQLSTSQDELDRLTRVCAKYKALLETRKKKGILRMGTTDSSALIVTKRQVAEMLRSAGDSQLSDTPATLSDLRSLCAALLEQLQDKCTALAHQRKANRLLAEQCTTLRQQADRHGLSVQPSAELMEGYSATNIDRESEQLLKAAGGGGGGENGVVAGDGGWSRSDQGPDSDPSTPDGEDNSCSSPDRAGTVGAPSSGSVTQRCHTATGSSWRRRQQLRQSGADGSCSDDAPGSPAAGGLSSLTSPTSGSDRPSRRHQELGEEEEEEEEILSIQQLDRYVRCLRQDGGDRPARVITEHDGGQHGSPPLTPARPADGGAASCGRQDGQLAACPTTSPPPPPPAPTVQVVTSPARAAPAASPAEHAELPAELDLLYRQALDQLRAGEQTT